MKIKRTYVIILSSLLILVIFLFFSDYIFNVLIKVEHEARIAEVALPPETKNIKFFIDDARKVNLKWKEALHLKGWVFRENVKRREREVQLVLRSEKTTLVFDIENDKISRPDVTKAFHIDSNLTALGYEIYIPLYRLKEDSYQLGVVITDETGKNYSTTTKAIILLNDSINIIEQEPSKTASVVPITLKQPVNKITWYFDLSVRSGWFYRINGWAFINGTNTDLQKAYILLRKGEKVVVFDTRMQVRKDITAAFPKFRQDLDSSGFMSSIPLWKLEKGRYRIGLYVEKGNMAGSVYTDKFLDISQ
jgi:hypothetical protein